MNSQITLESDETALIHFEDFINAHQDIAVLEETSSWDGEKIVCLVIEKLPTILTALTALIGVLKAKGIAFKLKENGVEKPLDSLKSS